MIYGKVKPVAGQKKRIRFTDIYGINEKKKIWIDRRKIKFYVLLAIAFLLLNILGSLSENSATIPKRIVNNIWLILFLLPLNFILFEYTIPFIKLKWKRIFIGLLLVWVHLMLYSFGLNGWRNLGIQLHTYFELRLFSGHMEGPTFFMAYSMSSVFFFGIIRHIYNYIKLKDATRQLRIEKQNPELNYLKSKTNPHFLFNTLNNIYSLARDKSDLAPESILRLF